MPATMSGVHRVEGGSILDLRSSKGSSESASEEHSEISSSHSVDSRISSNRSYRQPAGTWPAWAQPMEHHHVRNLLVELMSRIPLSSDQRTCCNWHRALEQTSIALRRMSLEREGKCRIDWFPCFAWQCQSCLCLNDLMDEEGGGFSQCDFCGAFQVDNTRLSL